MRILLCAPDFFDVRYEINPWMDVENTPQTLKAFSQWRNIIDAIGKAGGNAAAQSEAISRLISLALRSGIDPNAIVKQLKGISGPNPTWEDGRLILSTPDAIGKALDDYLKEGGENNQVSDRNLEEKKTPITMATTEEVNDLDEQVTDFTFKNISTCPDCGSSVMHEAGCVTCPGCGFSKCE